MRAQRRAGPLAAVVVSALAAGWSLSLALVPGFLATSLVAEFGIRHWQVGLLVSLHFACTALGSVPAGRVVDRWGPRLVVVADMALVMLGVALAIMLGTYAALLVAVSLSGFGCAFCNIGANVAVVGSVSERRRTVALATRAAGIAAVGALFAGIGPWMADRWRWEWVLSMVGIGAAVVMVVAGLVLPDGRLGHPVGVERRLPKGFVWLPVALSLSSFGTLSVYAWSVPYLQESLGASPALSGVLVGVAAAGGAGIVLVVGLLADRLDPRQRTRLVMALSVSSPIAWGIFGFMRHRVRLAMVIAMGMGIFVALIMAGGTFGVGVAVVGVVGVISLETACTGAILAAVADRAGPALARATGFTMAGAYLGAVLGPVSFGGFLDGGGSYQWGWFIVCVVMVATAVSLRLAGWIAPSRRLKAMDRTPAGSRSS